MFVTKELSQVSVEDTDCLALFPETDVQQYERKHCHLNA
jgi:hypothetical protein